MKQRIELWEYAGHILEQLGKGVLITAAADGKVNPMTIGWGTIGIQWRKPIFVAFVRESRYTKTLLDKNPEFTVNIPIGEFDKNILSVCGTCSGRQIDKVAQLGLTLEPGRSISVPGIAQLPLTLECKLIYRQEQDRAAIDAECLEKYYTGPNAGDFHTAYYGEITDAYIIK